MGYGAILKRAWEVTWKHKILWLFGLFAGSMIGGSSRTADYSVGNTGGMMTQGQTSVSYDTFKSTIRDGLGQAQAFYQQYAIVIWFAVFVAFMLMLVFLVVSVAARGGLVHLVNEVEEGRPARAGAGWRVGFAKWWRVFGIGFIAGLPMAVIGLLLSGATVAVFVLWLGSADPARPDANLIGTIVIIGCAMFVLSIIGLFLGITLAISAELGLRYAVLQDRGVMASLKQGWHDVWGKRGAFVMFLVQAGVGILYAIVFGIVASVLAGPTVVSSGAAGLRVVQPAGAGLTFLLIVPAAIYGAFYHASWTVFFRRMTGMEQSAAAAPVDAPFATPVPEVPAPPAPIPPSPVPSDG